MDSGEGIHPAAGAGEARTGRSAPEPRSTSAPRLLLHLGLLLATIVTTTLMGALLSVPAPASDDPAVVIAALSEALVSSPVYFANGAVFSFTLLVILGAHELGHYFACRYYGIDASLPYFLPAPPPVLIGTLGAFIRIRSPFPSRRALFDVGVAGPIAGFCFALPATLVGLLVAEPAASVATEGALVFNDPLLFVAVQQLFGLPQAVEWNPIYFAAWVAIFATGLNLIPVGQLDGGHAVAALFGLRGHRVVSVLFFVAVTTLALLSFLRYESPVWFLFVAVLSALAFRRHPPTLDEEPDIGPRRRLVAALVALIFLLSFMPFPITIG